MATAFKFELVTPERVLMSADVDQVLVPGADGDLTILAGHAPVISTLRPGIIEARTSDGKTTRIYVRGGFCEIAPDSLTILAERASDAEAMTGDALASEMKSAEAELASAGNDDARWIASTAINSLKRLGGKAA
jgi:F-type H+-transporting ATPase subunit epsilon